MGYALFATRKLVYTNLVFSLQSQLDNIMQQKNNLLTFAANISDGMITVEELASDPTNFNNYAEYLQQADAYINTPDDEGGAGTTIGNIGSLAAEQNNTEEYLASIAETLNTQVNEKFAKQYSKQLEVLENQLDLKQQKIETKLTAAQQELQAVKEAEGQAIQNATPKYSGVA